MIPLYTQEQFEAARTRDKLPLCCEQCGKTFEIIKKNIREAISSPRKERQSMGRFCCRKCATAFHFPANAKCAECGEEFRRASNDIAAVKNTFCSSRCSAIFNNRVRWGEREEKTIFRHRKRLSEQDVSLIREKTLAGESNDIIAETIGVSTSCINQRLKRLGLKPNRGENTVVVQCKRLNKEPKTCECCGRLTSNKRFCSGSCRNKILNPLIKGQRSKAEKLLTQSLRENYPLWTIIENDRTLLEGLELDVYIKEINIAIEWNGIFHYEPIRGRDGLEKIMIKDNKKIELCKQKGIELIVICDRTSHDRFVRETISSLVEQLRPLYKTHPV